MLNQLEMPRIDKVFSLEITPERFVKACCAQEFQELLIEVERRIQRESRMSRQIDLEQLIKEQKYEKP